MKNVLKNIRRSWKPVAAGALCSMALLGPINTEAKPVTQLTFLRTLAQLSGDAGKFNVKSKSSDYVTWAIGRGVDPTGGWKPGSVLTSQVLAQSLVQLFELNPRNYGGDPFRILEREGILIDRTRKVESDKLASLLDNPSVTEKGREVAEGNTSPHRPPRNGHGHGFGLGDHDDDDKFPHGKGNDDDRPGRGHGRSRNGKTKGSK